jgi:hypothetical protein
MKTAIAFFLGSLICGAAVSRGQSSLQQDYIQRVVCPSRSSNPVVNGISISCVPYENPGAPSTVREGVDCFVLKKD